jgi:hypothetical protein
MVRTTLATGTLVYRCRGKSAAGKCPAPSTIMQPALDNHVWAEVLDHYEEGDSVGSRKVARAELAKVHGAIAEARTRRETFSDSRVVARLGPAVWDAEVEAIDVELGRLEVRRLELSEAAGEYDLVVGSFALEDRRQLIVRVVDAVVVSRVANRGSNRAPITDRVEILYKRSGGGFVRPSRNRPVGAAGVTPA